MDANKTVLKPDSNSPKGVVHRPRDSPPVTPGAARPHVTGRETSEWHFTDNDDIDLLHDVAHGLHFASIGVLGFLVLEVRTNTRL